MGLFSNERKMKAAAASMHQFCQEVRHMFPGDVDDRVIEASTAYIYVKMTQDLFGNRFASKLQRRLRNQLKYATPSELEGRIAGISRHAEGLEQAASQIASDHSPDEMCRLHTSCVIEALLALAGFNGNDPQVTKQAYMRFEEIIRDMRKHLIGIKEQNYFLMKTKAPV